VTSPEPAAFSTAVLVISSFAFCSYLFRVHLRKRSDYSPVADFHNHRQAVLVTNQIELSTPQPPKIFSSRHNYTFWVVSNVGSCDNAKIASPLSAAVLRPRFICPSPTDRNLRRFGPTLVCISRSEDVDATTERLVAGRHSSSDAPLHVSIGQGYDISCVR
jgi:hypothetical protein